MLMYKTKDKVMHGFYGENDKLLTIASQHINRSTPHILQESIVIEFFTLEKYSPTTREYLNWKSTFSTCSKYIIYNYFQTLKHFMSTYFKLTTTISCFLLFWEKIHPLSLCETLSTQASIQKCASCFIISIHIHEILDRVEWRLVKCHHTS